MVHPMSNTKRIAKNTLMLYFRQILIMLVSLYTVRAVLETLGAEDYGIYNLVAGVVTMFGFLGNSMSAASQRYFSFEIGRGDFNGLEKTFSLFLMLYVIIAILVLLFAETIGLWFVHNKLVIPSERVNAARWIYQFSIISFLLTIMATPYTALIIAHEDMNIYAFGSIVEVLFKLISVFLLRIVMFDKLQLYGILMCIATFISTTIFRVFCKIKYRESKFHFYFNVFLFREYFCYTGWNLFGIISVIMRNQGINILLNQFFNAGVIAARSISFSINSAVSSFMFNFNTAIRPGIIKYCASGKKDKMISLIFRSTKISYFLMYAFTLPLVLEMPIVLSLWLKNPPPYTVIFTRLVLIELLVGSLSVGFSSGITATGKIKTRELVIGGIYFLNLPLSWLAIVFVGPPYLVTWILIFLTFITLIAEVQIAHRLLSFSLGQCFNKVMMPLGKVTIISLILPVILHGILTQSFLRLCIVTFISILSLCISMYLCGLNDAERNFVKKVIINKINVLPKH
jgi:O-antigen/teichoic acid export membrane protein